MTTSDLQQVIEIIQAEFFVRFLCAVVTHKLGHSVLQLFLRFLVRRHIDDSPTPVHTCVANRIFAIVMVGWRGAFWGWCLQRLHYFLLISCVAFHRGHVGGAWRNSVQQLLVVAVKVCACTAAVASHTNIYVRRRVVRL